MKQIFEGLRFRVFAYITLFAAGLLSLFYILQITLLPYYYQNQVFKQVEATSRHVTALMNAGEETINFMDVYDGLYSEASQHNLCVYVFDAETRIKVELNSMGSTCYLDYLISPTRDSQDQEIPIIAQYVELADSSSSNNYYFTVQPNELMSSQLFYGQATMVNNQSYYIFINTPYKLVDSTVTVLKDQFQLVSLIVFALSMVVAFGISKRLSKPIVDMSKEAKKLADGDMNVQFPHGGYTEIDNLADTLNYATHEIQKTDNLRSDLLVNISHDIRTPLTMISAYTEMIQDISKDDPIKRDEHLKIIIQEVGGLNNLLSNMMTLSQVQSNTTRLNITEFDLVRLTKNILETYSQSNSMNDVHFLYEGVSKAQVVADEIKTRQIVQNFLTNAYKNVGEDHKVIIRIMVIDETGYVRLEVIDHGKGILEEDLEHIWDRYYKGNKNYQRAQEGTGLGLAITKAICERMGLPYGVLSEKGEGSLFFVKFPMANESLFTRKDYYEDTV